MLHKGCTIRVFYKFDRSTCNKMARDDYGDHDAADAHSLPPGATTLAPNAIEPPADREAYSPKSNSNCAEPSRLKVILWYLVAPKTLTASRCEREG